MTVKEFYEQTGGDYEGAIELLMSDDLVQKFLVKFKASSGYTELEAAVEEGDIEKSFQAAHTLKGTAGNVRLLRLQKAACDLTEQLRSREEAPDQALLELVRVRYQEVMEALDQLTA